MNGVPLHPMVVHFPIALVVLLPLVALGALLLIRRGAVARRTWAVPVVFAGALAASSWVALQTGEQEEDRVEAVVSEAAIHAHEEAGERFLVLSGVLFAVAAAGLIGGTVGTAARLASTVGAAALIVAGVQVGHAGGELVYRHGAAAAYVDGNGVDVPMEAAGRAEHDDDDEG